MHGNPTHAPVLARFGYAISDPTRAQVLLALAESPSYPSDLADTIGVSRQSMSNHLTCLRGCGLVVQSRTAAGHDTSNSPMPGWVTRSRTSSASSSPWTRPAARPRDVPA